MEEGCYERSDKDIVDYTAPCKLRVSENFDIRASRYRCNEVFKLRNRAAEHKDFGSRHTEITKDYEDLARLKDPTCDSIRRSLVDVSCKIVLIHYAPHGCRRYVQNPTCSIVYSFNSEPSATVRWRTAIGASKRSKTFGCMPLTTGAAATRRRRWLRVKRARSVNASSRRFA